MFKNSKLFKKILSGISAVVIMASNALSFIPASAADNEPAGGYAHDINVFSLDIKTGAIGYNGYSYTSNEKDENGENIVKTITDDENNVVKPAYVWKADNSNEGHKFVYNIKLSVSGEGTTDIQSGDGSTEEAVGAGFIKITVPAHILRTADGAKGDAVDSLELPVPSEDEVYYQTENGVVQYDANGERKFYKLDEDGKKVYDTHEFVYKYDSENDAYIIYNTQPVSAGVVYEFPIAYCTEQKTWNYKDLGPSDPCKASLTIRSWEKDNTSQQADRTAVTNEIPVYIDTSAEIKSVQKSAEIVNGKAWLTPAQVLAKTGLSVSDDYRYVIWDVNTTVDEVTQKYKIELKDTISDITGSGKAKGEIIGYKLSGDASFTALADGTDKIDVTTTSTFTNAGRRTAWSMQA